MQLPKLYTVSETYTIIHHFVIRNRRLNLHLDLYLLLLNLILFYQLKLLDFVRNFLDLLFAVVLVILIAARHTS